MVSRKISMTENFSIIHTVFWIDQMDFSASLLENTIGKN